MCALAGAWGSYVVILVRLVPPGPRGARFVRSPQAGAPLVAVAAVAAAAEARALAAAVGVVRVRVCMCMQIYAGSGACGGGRGACSHVPIRGCVCAKGAEDGLFVKRAQRQKKRKSVKKEERAACAWRVPKKGKIHGCRGVSSGRRVRLLRARVRGGMAGLARARPDRAAVAVQRRREKRTVPPIPWERNAEGSKLVGAAKTGARIGVWGFARFALAFEHG